MPEIYDEKRDETRDETRDDVEKDEGKKDKKIWKPGPWMLMTSVVLGICYVIGKLTGGSVDGSVDVNHHMDGDIDMSHTGKVELPVSGKVKVSVDTITYQEACKKCPEDKQDDCEDCKKEKEKDRRKSGNSGNGRTGGINVEINNNNGGGTQTVSEQPFGEGCGSYGNGGVNVFINNNNGGNQNIGGTGETKPKQEKQEESSYMSAWVPCKSFQH